MTAATASSEVRFFRLLFRGVLAGFLLLALGRVLPIVRYLTWEKTSVTFLGARSTTYGGGNHSSSCYRQYQVPGSEKVLTADAPCLLLIGARPRAGESVTVAFDRETGRVYSATEAFGLGGYEFLLLALALGTHFAKRHFAKRHFAKRHFEAKEASSSAGS